MGEHFVDFFSEGAVAGDDPLFEVEEKRAVVKIDSADHGEVIVDE